MSTKPAFRFLAKKPTPAKVNPEAQSIDQDLVRAGALLARQRNFKHLVTVFVEQAQDISRVDLAAFYILKDAEDKYSDLELIFKRTRFPVPDKISGRSDLIRFIRECREAMIFNNKYVSEKYSANGGTATAPAFLKEVLINPLMKSGMALPIVSPPREIGVLFVASRTPCFFNRSRFYFLDSYTKLAGGAMQTSRLFDETKESLQRIDALERYQKNVFNSMPNMIITTNPGGEIHYFNEAAAEVMGLGEDDLGTNLKETFNKSPSSNTLETIVKTLEGGSEILGLEGIYSGGEAEMDYSLNITPLRTPRGRKEGLTLLFTNQTRENELKQTVQAVSEERRIIKDMFCRYMSQEVMTNLLEAPDSVKLGGDKRNATVFFADIRGYTSFSEGREPEKIIEILNEYFSVAVEHVVNYRGYIDKFIGDCIMAVWGVPMMPAKDDAINAVSCALAIQDMVRSTNRKFFRNEAEKLRVGIGINTGPLIAGNLGSLQRMDYSVIGDTVNLAARLEGVAGANEVIVSHSTRVELGETFNLEQRPDVLVKGKEKPIKVFNVLGFS
jgi:PAS domain S-box-containing protein